MTSEKSVLGATLRENGVQFRVWAPDATGVQLRLGEEVDPNLQDMEGHDGFFELFVPDIGAGVLYRYQVDDKGPFPDPVSRYQPLGVHGPSAVVDPSAYRWRNEAWCGIELADAIFYELHVGTFTSQGTFRAAEAKLPRLAELGITAIELMPLADFPGNHNWGYDGVALFAPARCYGTPDDLRSLIDRAHELGMAVFLDVVYNHFGPDGAYQGAFSKHYFTTKHHTPWGDALNFDDTLSEPVREYFLENALYWIHDFRFDGLRLDATHAIKDDSPRHILASLAASVAVSLAGSSRRVHIVAEDGRNLACLVKPAREAGYGLSALWADDFHHQMRRALAGDSDGYFRNYDGSSEAIAKTAKQGWFFTGEGSTESSYIRGTDPTGLEYTRFVFCLQNHDQVGNRAFGERLHHQIEPAVYRAASALLLLLPQTPLLFMGQEWAASTPFCFFTDHNAGLGALVTEGRRKEFEHFTAFSGAEIPDPQSLDTFARSRLRWEERETEPHASVWRLYRSLLALRKSHRDLSGIGVSPELEIEAYDDQTVLLKHNALLAAFRLRSAGEVTLPKRAEPWEIVWSSEDSSVAPDPKPIETDWKVPLLRFARPGAIVLQAAKGEES